MSAYVYPIVLISLQDFCNHYLIARLQNYKGEQNELYNSIFILANKLSKFFGIAFLIALFIVKTSLPWYSPFIVGAVGFVGGVILFGVLNVITSRNWFADFLLKIVCVIGVIAIGVLEIMWLCSFVEIENA